MKKILLVATMLAGALSAQAGVAISEATYGIINIPIIAGMNAVGINLLPMAGETNIVENIILTDGLTAAAEQGNADLLHIYNGTGYTTYWLDSNNDNPVWRGDVDSPAVAPGSAMWILAKSGGTVYQIGTVASAKSTTIVLVNGNNFIANPFADELDLTTVDWHNVGAQDKFTSNKADLLRVYDGSALIPGYITYYYVESSKPAESESTGWYETMSQTKAPAIPAGEGFWFYRRNTGMTGNITINNPFVTSAP